MKIKSISEILCNIIENNSLFEMAFARKQILEKIRGLQIPINEHLIKLIRYDDKQNFQKHVNDLETWLFDIQDLDFQKSGKKLNASDYFNVLFVEPITSDDNVNYILSKERGKLKKYNSIPRLKTQKETVKILYKLHKEIAELLSKDNISDFFINLNQKIK